jgi:hypothetical protein
LKPETELYLDKARQVLSEARAVAGIASQKLRVALLTLRRSMGHKP